MRERFSKVRKDAGLTQDEFASRIGLTKNFVSLIETGKREPSDRTIKDVCREFGINEEWLKNGDGEMKIKLTRSAEIAQLTTDLLKNKDSFKTKLIMTIAKLDIEEMKLLERIARKLLKEEKEND